MILGERTPAGNDSPTLDNLFRRAAARRPDAVALIDPPNRADFTDGPPRRLRYGEADGAVSGLAARLRRLALPSDSVIGIALPNKVESVLTLLAVLRAGMIAAPLPLLWRRAEMANALERVGAKAIVTAARIGELDSGGLAMQVAAELFTVRHLCAFGIGPPDGVIALDQTPAAGADEIAPAARPTALDVAVATFDVTPDETVAVARNHAQWIAAGLILMLESELAPDSTILASCGLASFSGIAPSGDALAPVRRHPVPASRLRRGRVLSARPRRRLRYHGVAGTAAAGSGSSRLARLSPAAPGDRRLARARADGDEPGLAACRRRAHRCGGVRRDRPRGVAPRPRRPVFWR
jgi:hypothetical protein